MFRALLLAALLFLGSCASPPAETDARPALWAVRDADTTLYLFGTVHMLKPGLNWFDGTVRSAFDASDSLVLELVMPPQAEMQALVAELGMDPAGPPLAEQLPPAEAASLRAALPAIGLPADALDHAEPWLAATMLSAQPLRTLGYDEREGAEAVLTEAAREARKPVTGLETAREQLGYFDALPHAAQTRLLAETIDDIPRAGETLETMIAAWRRGDADGLGRLMNADLAANPALRQALLVQRNRRWAAWAAERMQRPGTVFIAVGAGHLAGSDSVLAMLADRGLKVERIQ